MLFYSIPILIKRQLFLSFNYLLSCCCSSYISQRLLIFFNLKIHIKKKKPHLLYSFPQSKSLLLLFIAHGVTFSISPIVLCWVFFKLLSSFQMGTHSIPSPRTLRKILIRFMPGDSPDTCQFIKSNHITDCNTSHLTGIEIGVS